MYEGEEEPITVKSFISVPSCVRWTRYSQVFFWNRIYQHGLRCWCETVSFKGPTHNTFALGWLPFICGQMWKTRSSQIKNEFRWWGCWEKSINVLIFLLMVIHCPSVQKYLACIVYIKLLLLFHYIVLLLQFLEISSNSIHGFAS